MKKYVSLLCLLSIHTLLSAQTVTGKLVDQTGTPLSGLQLQLYINPKVYTTSSAVDGSFTFSNITAVNNEQLPTGYSIANNYPNPFNPTTRFEVSVPGSAVVSADIFNVLGEKVHAVSDMVFHAEVNILDIELNGLPNGFYIARINIDGKYSVVKKMMLLYGSRHLHAAGNSPSRACFPPAVGRLVRVHRGKTPTLLHTPLFRITAGPAHNSRALPAGNFSQAAHHPCCGRQKPVPGHTRLPRRPCAPAPEIAGLVHNFSSPCKPSQDSRVYCICQSRLLLPLAQEIAWNVPAPCQNCRFYSAPGPDC